MPLDPANGYPYTPPTIAMAAGDEKRQAYQFAVDIDIAMRRHYAQNLQRLSETLYPFMYAEATFNGGRYTFCIDEHTTYVREDVNPVYTELKAIAHIPLGIYSIIFPYAEYSENAQWRASLTEFRDQVKSVSDRLDKLDLVEPTLTSSKNILDGAITFLNDVLDNNKFTIEEYERFCHGIGNDILVNQTAAAVDQVSVMRAYLEQWRGQVGDDVWDKMYVVFQCIWTVSKESAHEQIFKSMMKPEFHETHIVVSEAVKTLEDARLLLARILADRVLAAAVFDQNARPEFAQNIYSLSTERDLLAKSIESALGPGAPSGCPLGHR